MKLDIDSYREIVDSLTRNKSRSILTGFGVFWGIFMLLFLVGGGNGLKHLLSKNFEGFATNTSVLVSSYTSKPFKGYKEGRYWSLTLDDIDKLRLNIPELDVITPVMSKWGLNAVFGERSTNCNIKGVSWEYSKVEEPQMKFGRYINETDCSQQRKVCVLGERVYKSLFPDGSDPCGKFVKIGPLYYQVIGVDVSSGNININGSAQEAAIIPFPVTKKVYNMGNRVHLIAMTGKKGVQMSTLEEKTRSVIARSHSFDPGDQQALLMINTEQLFQLMDNLFKGVNFLIWLVGLGTILAGVVGVSNIMMVTVRERTTEIGIRRAIGATPSVILTQIMAESISLTVLAGSLGLLQSVLALQLMEKIVGDGTPFQISFTVAVVSLLMLSVLGVAAGMAPATRAMKIKPVDAMRDE